ncbi:GSCOCG00007072001-RA-CDS [Cotesia congregata]|uniref:Similar to PEX5: Peroxisomal targeting signal 1 receptor (Cricetulus griseus) n=1 Tax=Cotesia congregata TaxID=51543 RepID=A0A8J2H7L6_COTCN|nr:GSCOCG00007072001-RA-CDS [Cotesia congregata]CAG5082546.1 Similar to PEX5: Peroxisomal targeting signal 1 receptor (Cricetulus griseus) [Cotesia congregata]
MALREFVDGDCGGPSPFTTLTSHFVQDRGFREDGLHGSQGVPIQSATPNQLADEFLDSRAIVQPQTFKMKEIFQQINEIDNNMQPIAAPLIHQPLDQDSVWANQFSQKRTDFYESNTQQIWSENEQSVMPFPLRTSILGSTHQDANELGLGQTWAEDYIEHSMESVNNPSTADYPSAVENENPNIAYSKFMKFMHQEGELPVESRESSSAQLTDSKWTENFMEQEPQAEAKTAEVAKTPEASKNDEATTSSAEIWASQFSDNQYKKEIETYESAFWSKLQGEWEVLSKKEQNKSHPWISDYESYYDPFKNYKFNQENPMKNAPDALEQGKRRLEAGDLASAVLCFEAAVQQHPENPEAWMLLGKTQTENEQDHQAIAALKKCLTLDTSNAVALMTLAVAFTNESYQSQACITLKEWLIKSSKYKHLIPPRQNVDQSVRKSSVSTIPFNDLHNEVKNLYIQAARMNPVNEIDPDVQIGLGVLFNLSSEHEKAADCFRAALHVRPNDCRLWNQLGASLANGQKSEEAIDAYSRALEIAPGFIRARYNLGISCINLSAYQQAAEHLLTALNQQAAGRGVQGQSRSTAAMSDTIWSTLQLVISLLHKYHLNNVITTRDLDTLNKEFKIV